MIVIIRLDPTYTICPLQHCQSPVPPPPSVPVISNPAVTARNVFRIGNPKAQVVLTPEQVEENRRKEEDKWERFRECQKCRFVFCRYCLTTWSVWLDELMDDSKLTRKSFRVSLGYKGMDHIYLVHYSRHPTSSRPTSPSRPILLKERYMNGGMGRKTWIVCKQSLRRTRPIRNGSNLTRESVRAVGQRCRRVKGVTI